MFGVQYSWQQLSVDLRRCLCEPLGERNFVCQAFPDSRGIRQRLLETETAKGKIDTMIAKLTAYDSLLLKYKPRPIRNDQEYRRVLRHVEELIGRHGPIPPRAEGELIAVLSTLIESYEVASEPRRKPMPAETLEHLIESKQVTRAKVSRATGIPASTITNVLSGRRQISRGNVTKLATYFRVDPSVFLPEG